MKPTIEQIDATIAATDDYIARVARNETTDTVLFALRFTKKIMGEPSEDAIVFGMEKSVLGRPSTDDDAYVLSIFKAMRDQAIREVEDEN